MASSGGSKAERKLRARNRRDQGLFFGLGMFGLVGFSVAVPTAAGALIGLWLDSIRSDDRFSWTLSLLVAGVVLGCFNAWRWVVRESKPENDQ